MKYYWIRCFNLNYADERLPKQVIRWKKCVFCEKAEKKERNIANSHNYGIN